MRALRADTGIAYESRQRGTTQLFRTGGNLGYGTAVNRAVAAYLIGTLQAGRVPAVAPEAADAWVGRIREAGYPLAAIIGTVEDGSGVAVVCVTKEKSHMVSKGRR